MFRVGSAVCWSGVCSVVQCLWDVVCLWWKICLGISRSVSRNTTFSMELFVVYVWEGTRLHLWQYRYDISDYPDDISDYPDEHSPCNRPSMPRWNRLPQWREGPSHLPWSLVEVQVMHQAGGSTYVRLFSERTRSVGKTVDQRIRGGTSTTARYGVPAM